MEVITGVDVTDSDAVATKMVAEVGKTPDS